MGKWAHKFVLWNVRLVRQDETFIYVKGTEAIIEIAKYAFSYISSQSAE